MRLRRLAQEKEDTELLVVAHYGLGYTTLCMANFADARRNFEEGIARYLPTQRSADIYRAGQDPGVACRAYLGMTEWLLGFPERAQNRMRESVALAEELGDPFSLAYALCFTGAVVSEACGGDTDAVVERGLGVATEGGFALWVANANVHRTSLRFDRQRSDAALEELRQSVAAISRMGVLINTPYFMSFLVQAYRQARRIDDGLRVLDDAQANIDARDERWWEAELHRLRGELVLARHDGDHGEAEKAFSRALATARHQEAKSLELRAAMSLARLWQGQGKTTAARELLAPVYQSFSEGFDTPDLKDAKELLDELS